MALFPTAAQALAIDCLPAIGAFGRLDEEPWRAFERRDAGASGFGAAEDGVAFDIRALALLPAWAVLQATVAAKVDVPRPQGVAPAAPAPWARRAG